MCFLKYNVLRTVFAARFYILNFILHASVIDIIWETGFVMAQLWSSFSPSLAFFSPAPALQSPLDIKILRFRPGPWAWTVPPFPCPSQPERTSNTEPTTLFCGYLLGQSFTLHHIPPGVWELFGRRDFIFIAFFPPLGSIFLI